MISCQILKQNHLTPENLFHTICASMSSIGETCEDLQSRLVDQTTLFGMVRPNHQNSCDLKQLIAYLDNCLWSIQGNSSTIFTNNPFESPPETISFDKINRLAPEAFQNIETSHFPNGCWERSRAVFRNLCSDQHLLNQLFQIVLFTSLNDIKLGTQCIRPRFHSTFQNVAWSNHVVTACNTDQGIQVFDPLIDTFQTLALSNWLSCFQFGFIVGLEIIPFKGLSPSDQGIPFRESLQRDWEVMTENIRTMAPLGFLPVQKFPQGLLNEFEIPLAFYAFNIFVQGFSQPLKISFSEECATYCDAMEFRVNQQLLCKDEFDQCTHIFFKEISSRIFPIIPQEFALRCLQHNASRIEIKEIPCALEDLDSFEVLEFFDDYEIISSRDASETMDKREVAHPEGFEPPTP